MRYRVDIDDIIKAGYTVVNEDLPYDNPDGLTVDTVASNTTTIAGVEISDGCFVEGFILDTEDQRHEDVILKLREQNVPMREVKYPGLY